MHGPNGDSLNLGLKMKRTPTDKIGPHIASLGVY